VKRRSRTTKDERWTTEDVVTLLMEKEEEID